MDKPFRIKTISELHQLAGGPPPEHPLISLVPLEMVRVLPEGYPRSFIYDFYSIGFKKNLKGYVDYGRKSYDFQEGVLGFTAPHQILSFTNSDASEATGWLLFFHEQFLAKSPLTEKIKHYGFFRYTVNEALHLSPKEEALIEGLFENIHGEHSQRIDQYSKEVILSNIALLLTYSERFYGRQFITRNEVDSSFVERFQSALQDYCDSEQLVDQGLPSVERFAEQLQISSGYLNDMLKSLTGMTTKEHVHYHLVEKAKDRLLASDESIARIGYSLGFEYPQYFTTLFKSKTGLSPSEFRGLN